MTGAGKTEMIYNIVAYVLENKGHVLSQVRGLMFVEIISTYEEGFYL